MRESYSRTTAVGGLVLFGSLVAAFGSMHQPLSAQVRGATFSFDRPDAYGPAGLLADHLLSAGQFEIGYRFETRDYDGLRDAGEEVSPEFVLRYT